MSNEAASPERKPSPKIDTTVPHSARVWNYWLGGKDNYPVDREAGDAFARLCPKIIVDARATRHYMARAVRHLAGETGIRQFLDIGTGLPTVDNTHQIAQRVAPESRIVYVDNDPLVLAHARALLTSTPEGRTWYIDADVRDPESILAEVSGLLDLSRPTALMLMGILGHVADLAEARSIVRRLMDALPSGSHLVHYDGTDVDEACTRATRFYNDNSGGIAYHLRTPEQLGTLHEGLETLEPGMVMVTHWRPDPSPFDLPDTTQFGAVSRKP
ncbi:SAM-dependent methyltransferase [Streptomyces sp. YIM 98790]|uniref:SAM-dependent methyltransferase n=1 Tax=Streptomyces sp. YIM 98790 TaxID=2689077 RepID=UPI00140B12BE|nr:SAM-dependent methyltransferase [Streptomyces sp. YIM 98790]